MANREYIILEGDEAEQFREAMLTSFDEIEASVKRAGGKSTEGFFFDDAGEPKALDEDG